MQPRKEFSAAELLELVASIGSNGLLQPITVRRAGSGFELIAGERRLRAVQQLGWHEIPAIVQGGSGLTDKDLLTLALVENLQRADLNPIEEAEGYQQLVSQFSLTHREVADVVGKDRSTVANTLRLLALPSSIRTMVREGGLSIGHARALLALADEAAMIEMANAIIAEHLNVRDVERRVRASGTSPGPSRSRATRETKRSPEASRIEQELRRHFQTDVTLHLTAKDKGEVRIAFYSADDLERLLELALGVGREAL